MVVIELNKLYNDVAKLQELDNYVQKAKAIVDDGKEVVLTGQAPVWMYLKIAHALHGKASKLSYRSPVTGDVVIFDHNPY